MPNNKVDDESSGDSEEEFQTDALKAAFDNLAGTTGGQVIDIEKFKKGRSTEVIPCRTALARRILNVFEEKWPDKSELFLPGRMQYVIPIDDNDDSSFVTTILKSKAETDQQDDTGKAGELAFDKLLSILAKIKNGDHNQPDSTKKMKYWERDDDLL